MFVVTSLPQIHDQNKVYKFTFFDKYMLSECSDGCRNILHNPHPHYSPPVQSRIDKTESVLAEQIMFPGTTWYRFPVGTFDKIIENVYNFKGGDLIDLLN